MSFKGFSTYSSMAILFSRVEPILAILVKGHKRNISVKLF